MRKQTKHNKESALRVLSAALLIRLMLSLSQLLICSRVSFYLLRWVLVISVCVCSIAWHSILYVVCIEMRVCVCECVFALLIDIVWVLWKKLYSVYDATLKAPCEFLCALCEKRRKQKLYFCFCFVMSFSFQFQLMWFTQSATTTKSQHNYSNSSPDDVLRNQLGVCKWSPGANNCCNCLFLSHCGWANAVNCLVLRTN